MDERAAVQKQMSEIGDRFLRRTLGEVERLRELLERLRGGARESLKEIEVMVHKIHGSGAMFGFDELSDAAYECEILAMNGDADPEIAVKVAASLETIESHLAAAARTRGIER